MCGQCRWRPADPPEPPRSLACSVVGQEKWFDAEPDLDYFEELVQNFFIVISATGLMLSTMVHVLVLSGMVVTDNVRFLGFGLIAVVAPLAISLRLPDSRYQGMNARDICRIIELGCPFWMRLATCVVGVYAIVNFGLTMNSALVDPLRLLSGNWMAMYMGAFAIYFAGRQEVFPEG